MHRVEKLLRRESDGDHAARNELVELLHPWLLDRARERLGRGRTTLEPAELVHDLYVKITRRSEWPWATCSHLLGALSTAMQNLVYDVMRSDGVRQQARDVLIEIRACMRSGGIDTRARWIELHDELELLARVRPRWAEVVRLTFFCGLKSRAAGEVLGVSDRTVERDLAHAAAWLGGRLT